MLTPVPFRGKVVKLNIHKKKNNEALELVRDDKSNRIIYLVFKFHEAHTQGYSAAEIMCTKTDVGAFSFWRAISSVMFVLFHKRKWMYSRTHINKNCPYVFVSAETRDTVLTQFRLQQNITILLSFVASTQEAIFEYLSIHISLFSKTFGFGEHKENTTLIGLEKFILTSYFIEINTERHVYAIKHKYHASLNIYDKKFRTFN